MDPIKPLVIDFDKIRAQHRFARMLDRIRVTLMIAVMIAWWNPFSWFRDNDSHLVKPSTTNGQIEGQDVNLYTYG